MISLSDLLSDVHTRIAEIERRVDGMIKRGPCAAVDPAKGLARVRLGGTDDAPFLSAWMPYSQQAGALKVHVPPAIGQPMVMFSEGGDFRNAHAFPSTWSDGNPSPSQKGDENVVTYGPFRISLAADALTVTKGGVTVTIGDKVSIKAAVEIDGPLTVTNGDIVNNGKSVGATHRHGGVDRGGSDTDPPV